MNVNDRGLGEIFSLFSDLTFSNILLNKMSVRNETKNILKSSIARNFSYSNFFLKTKDVRNVEKIIFGPLDDDVYFIKLLYIDKPEDVNGV